MSLLKTLVVTTLLMISCSSTSETVEYVPYLTDFTFDWEKPIQQTSYNKLPSKAKAYITDCYTQNDIKKVYLYTLYLYNIPAYSISFSDKSEIMFDKKGNFLHMHNWKYGLPDCLTSKIPLFGTMRKAIEHDLNTSKQWIIQSFENQKGCYVFKVNVSSDPLIYVFDKKGNLQEMAVEI